MSDDPPDKTGETTGSAEGLAGKKLSLFSMALWGPEGPPEDVFGRSDLWSFCAEDDGHDDDCWGHVSPIREPVAIPPPNMLISRRGMQAIAMGYAPMGMDDKWLAFMEDDRLFLHRSWTGHGIYEVTFAAKETGFMATSARIESHPDRQRGDFDPENFDPVRERDELRDLIALVSGDPMPVLLPTIVSRDPALEAVLGDIADQDVNAIVNTANRLLADGDGVNGAIHRAAGPELLRHCRALGAVTLGGLSSPRASDSRLGGSFTPWRRSGPVALAASRCCWSRATANPWRAQTRWVPKAWPSRQSQRASAAIRWRQLTQSPWTSCARHLPRCARSASSASTGRRCTHSSQRSKTAPSGAAIPARLIDIRAEASAALGVSTGRWPGCRGGPSSLAHAHQTPHHPQDARIQVLPAPV